MAIEWRSAFLRQARSDFEVACVLLERRMPRCQILHTLQMALEKLGKGMMVGASVMPPAYSHKSAAAFFQILATHQATSNAFRLSIGMSGRAWREYVRSLLPTIEAIERLAPALAGKGPNCEYPWIDAASAQKVVAPVDYGFDPIHLSETKILRVVKLLDVLLMRQSAG